MPIRTLVGDMVGCERKALSRGLLWTMWVLLWGPWLWGSGSGVVELSPYLVEAWHFDMVGEVVPAEVVRLDAAAIGEAGAPGVPELLERLAGVRFRSFTGNGVEGQLALRGFGDNSGLRVLVLVDGQEYNAPDMGGINWLGMDTEELELVEVIRGGQGVLYGNHAVAGVVKLRLKEPGGELGGSLRTGVGSDGYRQAAGYMGQGFDKLGLRAGADWRESDGYRDHSGYNARTGYLAWSWRGAEDGRWSGRIALNGNTVEYPGPLTWEQFRENPRQSATGGGEFSDTTALMATLRGEGESDWGAWQVNGGYLERKRDSSLGGSWSTNDHRRVNLAPRVKLGGGSGFMVVGGDLRGDWLDFRDFLGTGKRVVRAWAEVDRLTAGAFGFFSVSATERISLSGGVRMEGAESDYDYIHYVENQLLPVLETNRGPVPNPNYRDPPEVDTGLSYSGPVEASGWAGELSVTAKLSPGWHGWIGWDRVYRYPALDETASYQGYPLSNPLNTELEPETGDNFEIGLKRSLAGLSASLTTFLMLLDDEIAFDNERRLNVNLGRTRRHGVEGSVVVDRPGYGWRMFGSWTEANFRSETPHPGSRLPLVPEFETGIAVWVRPNPQLRVSLDGRYLGAQMQGNDYGNTLRKIPGYVLWNLGLRWEPVANLAVHLSVDNLFDRRHAVSAYEGGYYPGAGQQVRIDVKYRFGK